MSNSCLGGILQGAVTVTVPNVAIDLLKEQREVLSDMVNRVEYDDDDKIKIDAVDGILNLIDAIITNHEEGEPK